MNFPIKKIKDQCKELKASIAKYLEAQDYQSAKEKSDQLDLNQQFIRDYNQHYWFYKTGKRWLLYFNSSVPFIFLIVLALTIFGIGLSLKRTVLARLDLSVSQINMEVVLRPSMHFASNSVSITSVVKADLLGTDFGEALGSQNTLYAEGKNVNLTIDSSQQIDTIHIQRIADKFYLRIYSDSVRMQLDLSQGQLTVNPGQHIHQNEGVFPSACRILAVSKAGPIQIGIQDTIGIEFPEFVAKNIWFTEEGPLNEQRSSIYSGNLSLAAIQKEFPIKSRHNLRVKPKRGAWVNAMNTKDGMDVMVDGKFRKLSTTYRDPILDRSVDKTFRPTKLFYWLNNQIWVIYVGTITWIIGFLWSIRGEINHS